MSLLRVEDLHVNLRGRRVLRGVSVEIEAGQVTALIGPNGAGKSTLLRAALGLVPGRGRASLAELPPRARAKAAAFLPQAREIAWPVTVETIVALGRDGTAEDDRAAIEGAMRRTDTLALRHRRADRLSGGEQARVLLARVLAQDAPLLLADEPTSGLDPAHQIAAMETFAALSAEGRGVLVSLHDLGLAARWCGRVVLLSEGRIVADGPPRDVLTPGNLAETYGIKADIAYSETGMTVQPVARL